MAKRSDLDRDIAERMKDPVFAAAFHQRRLTHEIARAVRSMREAAGLSQAQLAKLVGTSQPNIARLETSQHMVPQWKLLDRIAWALGRQLQLAFVEPGKSKPLVRVEPTRRKPAELDREEAARRPPRAP